MKEWRFREGKRLAQVSTTSQLWSRNPDRVSDSQTRDLTSNGVAFDRSWRTRMARMEAHAPAHTPGPSSWNSRHPLKHRLMSTTFSREAEVIWASGCQRSSSDPPCSIQPHKPDFLASSQQRRAAKTNKCRHCAGYRCMNGTILCWPTLATLFSAMNRAVWKKTSHTKRKQQNLSLCDGFNTG